MKAVGYRGSLPVDHPEALSDLVLDKPEATGRDLLVKVEAVAVNPVDTKVRKRKASEDGRPIILGWDASGVVESVGEEVEFYQPGDRVWYAGAIDRPGSNAEFQLVEERIVGRMPESLGFAEAAAMPLTGITAWEILFDRLGFSEESTGTLLIIGGAGGVGSMMIQLARKLTGLTVIATASREKTQEWVSSLGGEVVINHREAMVPQLAEQGITSIDHVASLTHTDQHLAEVVELIAPQGSMAVIDDPPVLDIMPFKTKSVSIHWELMFTRSLFQTTDMALQRDLLNELADLVDSGEVKSTLTESFGTINATNLLRAHQLLESGKAVGKIVLEGF